MDVEAVDSAEKARRLVPVDFPGIVVTDIRLPGHDGMALMHDLLRQDRDLPVVLMTGHGDVSLAVQAMKDGAHDFIEKPFSPDYFVEVVRRALEKRRLTLEVRELRAQKLCADGIPERELPADCVEYAATPADLFARLDDWGFDALVIPHGNAWGYYTPPGSSWDKQLTRAQHDPQRQTLWGAPAPKSSPRSAMDFAEPRSSSMRVP